VSTPIATETRRPPRRHLPRRPSPKPTQADPRHREPTARAKPNSQDPPTRQAPSRTPSLQATDRHAPAPTTQPGGVQHQAQRADDTRTRLANPTADPSSRPDATPATSGLRKTPPAKRNEMEIRTSQVTVSKEATSRSWRPPTSESTERSNAVDTELVRSCAAFSRTVRQVLTTRTPSARLWCSRYIESRAEATIDDAAPVTGCLVALDGPRHREAAAALRAVVGRRNDHRRALLIPHPRIRRSPVSIDLT
jgi:hypothetical protein